MAAWPAESVQFLAYTSVPDFANTLCSNGDDPTSIEREVRVGARLPTSGVRYYDVPREYGIRGYRYTVVNDRPVLVDRSYRIVEIIE